ACDGELQAAFEKHHGETETHVSRLEQVFGAIDAKPQGKTCDATMGIIEEGQEIMKEYKGSRPWMPAWSRRPRPGNTMKSHATARCVRGRTNWPLGRREASGSDAARGKGDRRGAVTNCRNGREPGSSGSGCGLSHVEPLAHEGWRTQFLP